VQKTPVYQKGAGQRSRSVYCQEVAMKKPKVKPVRTRLREDLKNPAFRTQYEEKKRTEKLATKIATQRDVKKD
jgi:hypothetical protein